jgi:hypothetical protein
MFRSLKITVTFLLILNYVLELPNIFPLALTVLYHCKHGLNKKKFYIWFNCYRNFNFHISLRYFHADILEGVRKVSKTVKDEKTSQGKEDTHDRNVFGMNLIIPWGK